MLFGAVKSGDASFCSIECARHNGCEPTRLFLNNGEQIGEVCAGCDIELDTAEYPTPASVDDPVRHPECSICRRRHGREIEHPCE
jgi:hypothetical protein